MEWMVKTIDFLPQEYFQNDIQTCDHFKKFKEQKLEMETQNKEQSC